MIIFESDDWGSIRMPSLEAFHRLEKAGIDLRSFDAERYNLNDNIESSADLSALFEILDKFKDSTGRSCVFTPITIVANPDFLKIRENNFENYFYEPFIETLKRTHPGYETFRLWKEGIERRLFVPQFHGREHLNILQWMQDLREKDNHTVLAFNEGVTGIVPANFPQTDYQAAFQFYDPSDIEIHSHIIRDGLQLFEKLFGYKAIYFVPPNGIISNNLNRLLSDCGIKYRSGSKLQKAPAGHGKTKTVVNWLGKKDRSGIRYITRNCFFEPGNSYKNWIDSCMNDIAISFKWRKPAIISTHRVNYIGSLDTKNRDKGLRELSALLNNITKAWPDVEFLTTGEIGNIIDNQKNGE